MSSMFSAAELTNESMLMRRKKKGGYFAVAVARTTNVTAKLRPEFGKRD
jgi:hypothetical protein